MVTDTDRQILAHQRDLVEKYDAAIVGLRAMIAKRGARPVTVLVGTSLDDGIRGAIKRRQQVHHALYLQLSNLTKGVSR